MSFWEPSNEGKKAYMVKLKLCWLTAKWLSLYGPPQREYWMSCKQQQCPSIQHQFVFATVAPAKFEEQIAACCPSPAKVCQCRCLWMPENAKRLIRQRFGNAMAGKCHHGKSTCCEQTLLCLFRSNEGHGLWRKWRQHGQAVISLNLAPRKGGWA